MRKTLLISCVSAASIAAALAAEPESALLQAYPKNLARQHMGANLFQYSPTTQAYTPTQAAAAWLDDDITTGWSMLSGKQYYLMAFPEAEAIKNFSVSAKPAHGTISLYASDEAAPPGAASWTPLAKDIPFESLNEKKLSQSFSRTAKYLLIETNLSDPGPVYSLYVYGDRPAVAYEIRNREQAIDARAIFGPYVNESTAFNVSGLYAHSYVQPQQGQPTFTEMQRAIDDNPETSVTVGGSESPVIEIRSAEPHSVSRIALETNPGAKGRFEFFLKNGEEPGQNATPAGTIVLDGTTSRASVDFTPAEASLIQARWTPANGTDPVTVREINAFAGNTLAANTVTTGGAPDAIAEGPGAEHRVASRSSRDGKDYKDAKDAKDAKEAKEAVEPIAALEQGPYLPGALGFPPNLTVRRAVLPPGTPVLPPETPVSQ